MYGFTPQGAHASAQPVVPEFSRPVLSLGYKLRREQFLGALFYNNFG